MTKDQMLGAAKEAAVGTPPVAAVIAYLGGVTIEKWLVAATLAYTLIAIAHRLWHWNKPPAGK